MTEHEELIKRLRSHSDWEDNGELLHEAADALASLPTPPVAGETEHCGRGICAAMEGHGGTCAEASGWAVEGEPERDALRGVIGGVLRNATNFPKKVGVRILGQDMGPMIDRTVDALIAAGYRRQPGPRVVTTVEELPQQIQYGDDEPTDTRNLRIRGGREIYLSGDGWRLRSSYWGVPWSKISEGMFPITREVI